MEIEIRTWYQKWGESSRVETCSENEARANQLLTVASFLAYVHDSGINLLSKKANKCISQNINQFLSCHGLGIVNWTTTKEHINMSIWRMKGLLFNWISVLTLPPCIHFTSDTNFLNIWQEINPGRDIAQLSPLIKELYPLHMLDWMILSRCGSWAALV